MNRIEFHIIDPNIKKIKKYIIGAPLSKYINGLYKFDISSILIDADIDMTNHRYMKISINIEDSVDFFKTMRTGKFEMEIPTNSLCDAMRENNNNEIEYLIRNIYFDFDILMRQAIEIKSNEMIEVILSEGEYREIFSMLQQEYKNMNSDIIKTFLRRLAQFEDFHRSHTQYIKIAELLCDMIEEDDSDLIKLFKLGGVKIEEYHNYFVDKALEKGYENILEYLVDYKGDETCVDYKYYLLQYVKSDNTRIVELIFQLTDFDQDFINEIFSDAGKSSVDMIKILIENGADIDKCGKKIYKNAKKNKNKKLMKFLNDYNE